MPSRRAAGVSQASDSDPARSTVAPALRAIRSIAVFSLSAYTNSFSMPRLRACRIAWSNKRAPRPRRRARSRHRDAELGHRGLAADPRCRGVGQMRHGDQLEAAVEDAEHLVALEVDRVGVVVDLGVGGGKAETQVAVVLVEREQVSPDPVAVARCQRANRYPGQSRLGARLPRWAQARDIAAMQTRRHRPTANRQRRYPWSSAKPSCLLSGSGSIYCRTAIFVALGLERGVHCCGGGGSPAPSNAWGFERETKPLRYTPRLFRTRFRKNARPGHPGLPAVCVV